MSQTALACQLSTNWTPSTDRDRRTRRAMVLGPRLVESPQAADKYAQLERRRRRAQIAARHALDNAPEAAEGLSAGS